ncbi:MULTISPECIES: Maf family protein [Cytobacillus]|uniref:dTTP/UTP pyrophosphatase n=1 Tax=Cytobacillus stercorigallinarum TaxID=2762240 RepID=A0ABR8QJY5_9BACI|nr:Maf family protein [Cytobacillus stercorigallinarum]MBD7935677.1 septum formation inhibitor Maf [Cytobacillus stercorigallinarum]
MQTQTLILASTSPRRKQLLEQMNLSFKVKGSHVDERYDANLKPDEIVQTLAERKARAVYNNECDTFVIGSDTVVVHKGEVLGKPIDEEEAYLMLKNLSNGTHEVYTGVAILTANKITRFSVVTKVEFWSLSEEEIYAYIQTGEPFDKAGAYGIQGIGAALVKQIHGDYFAVMGLPISQTIRELRKIGYSLPHHLFG